MQQRRRRSGITIGLLSLGLLAGVALTASPAQAASGNGPYYAEPAWDRKMLANRFLILTNWASEAVLDKETGLVWERSPDAAKTTTWFEARVACTARTTGNRKGWRLPSVHELASLVDPSVASPGPTLPTGHPFLNVESGYWSATTNAIFPAVAWTVAFNNGNVDSISKDDSGHTLVWCARGGMNADQY
jgi:hypothetical protein